MAQCPGAKKQVQSDTAFLGGPYKTKAEAEAAIPQAMLLVASAAAPLCNGDCEDKTDLCQLALDDWDTTSVVGPFYASPKDGPGWYFKIPTGVTITYHCECLPSPVMPPPGGLGATASDEANKVYEEMKAKYGARWKCTPAQWTAIYNACRAAGGNVVVCASLASAQCLLP